MKSSTRRSSCRPWMGMMARLCLALALGGAALPVAAQQAGQTSGSALNVPSYNPVDANGVDLLSGRLIVRSPALSMGGSADPAPFYFQWSGQGWLPNTPRLWLDKDWHVIVESDGGSDEFADAVQQPETTVIPAVGTRYVYTQKRPNTGAQLACYFTGGLTGAGWISQCKYRSRQGVEISFYGNQVAFGGYPQNARFDNEAFGNTRAWPAVKYDPAQGGTTYLIDQSPQIAMSSNGGEITVVRPDGYTVKKTGTYYAPSITFTMSASTFGGASSTQSMIVATPSLNGTDNTLERFPYERNR